MIRSASWWLRRLQAMSGPEIALRTFRLARHPLHRAQMRAGLYGKPRGRVRQAIADWTGPDTFYFSPAQAGTPAGADLLERADRLCQGEREVLGLGWLAMPEVFWSYEPSTQAFWPKLDASRVMAAAPDTFDARLTWEFNRGHEWVVLARAYAATGNRHYRDHLTRELTSWAQHNPIGVGINWASPMEAAIRIHSFAWVAGFLRARADDLLPTLAEHIYQHARFIAPRLSYFSSANNHLIIELSALITSARVLGMHGHLTTWHRRALRRLIVELRRQTHDDGVNAEMATHYHMFVLETILLVARLERLHGAPKVELETVAAKMADYLAELICKDGSILGQGDDDGGVLLPFFHHRHADQLVACAQTLSADSAPSPSTEAPAPDREAVFWLTGGGLPRPPRRRTRSRHFPHSGQIILRSDRLLVTFNCGPFGYGPLAAHAHCDVLAINVAIDGVPILVDRGTYRYNGDPAARAYFRSTAAHNTVQIGDMEQAESLGPFLWGRRPTVTIERCDLSPERDIVVASHDGFAPHIHRRTLVREGDVLGVIDHVPSPAGQTITSQLHLGPGIDLARSETADGHRFAFPEGQLWTDASAVQARTSVHSGEYAVKHSAPVLDLELTGAPKTLSIVSAGPLSGPSLADFEHLASELAPAATEDP